MPPTLATALPRWPLVVHCGPGESEAARRGGIHGSEVSLRGPAWHSSARTTAQRGPLGPRMAERDPSWSRRTGHEASAPTGRTCGAAEASAPAGPDCVAQKVCCALGRLLLERSRGAHRARHCRTRTTSLCHQHSLLKRLPHCGQSHCDTYISPVVPYTAGHVAESACLYGGIFFWDGAALWPHDAANESATLCANS